MLTVMQKKVLFELNRYVEVNEIAPTLRELEVILGLKSVSTLHVHLSKLESKGYIERVAKSPRNIKIMKTYDNEFERNNKMIVSSGRTIITNGEKINSHLKFRIHRVDFELLIDKLQHAICKDNKDIDIYKFDYIDIIHNQIIGITILNLEQTQSDKMVVVHNIVTEWTRSEFFIFLSKINE